MRHAIVARPIDVAALLAEVTVDANGAQSVFVGTVREQNDGRAVHGIDYAAYDEMAQTELGRIVLEAVARFGTTDIVVEHRLGTLSVGEVSVAIAVGHPRRAPAMDAVRYIIEELKRRVPIWKREHYVDGTRGWVEATTSAAAVGAAHEQPGDDEVSGEDDDA
ncbi:MAG: molybdenum cofactor biosynthesis protein MoaE [Gemmatimonadaceae bacterium]|jgi:molybdopterin synthase catalytic subunit|nr:molybdenum cofactor biosynthesis protein MoaE [Gemmatimonadaceae bacterium]